MHTWEEMGVMLARILLPKSEYRNEKWSVVACDQFTSEPAYWRAVEETVGEAKSTLHLILPEMYLEAPDVQTRIDTIHQTMRSDWEASVFEAYEPGIVRVTRTVDGKTRKGIMVAVDLEAYDFSADSTSIIRATEGTIVERIPPRLRIREKADIELPHILVLLDDPHRTVIEPLFEREAKVVYDISLMQNGGRVKGEYLPESELHDFQRALSDLFDEKAKEENPILFAVGDGNHSLATAKAHWENVKTSLSQSEQIDHPARFALVEIENVHDEGIVFEPIHRVIFGADEQTLHDLEAILQEQNRGGGVRLLTKEESASFAGQCIACVEGEQKRWIGIEVPAHQLTVGSLQKALDALMDAKAELSIDYIHGADVVIQLAKEKGNVGFLLPTLAKSELFSSVQKDGPLPRKTFSMGEANEKRYYMECRKITK